MIKIGDIFNTGGYGTVVVEDIYISSKSSGRVYLVKDQAGNIYLVTEAELT